MKLNTRNNILPLYVTISPYDLTDDEVGTLLAHFMRQWEVNNG